MKELIIPQDQTVRGEATATKYQQAVAAHTGWKYEYVEGSWAELMSMLKNGQIDLLGGISYTEERSTSMLFSVIAYGRG